METVQAHAYMRTSTDISDSVGSQARLPSSMLNLMKTGKSDYYLPSPNQQHKGPQ